jgi:hypothetical protein
LITCNDQDINESPTIGFFSNQDTVGFYRWCDLSDEKGLERLVFRVSRKPRCLAAHVERIYYCFHYYLNEQLFAALIDLLIILNRYGQALSWRMIGGARSRLTPDQLKALVIYLKNSSFRTELLPSNRYSVFAKSLESGAILVQLIDVSEKKEHDPLVLARDYVEYSQLDNAIDILEKAILIQPERVELHDELLSLYRSTCNLIGFCRMYEEFNRNRISLPPEWKQLDDFFKGLSNDGK